MTDPDRHPVTIHVNGTTHIVETEARRTLADLLRDELDLTGTNVGCEQGVCGACTVHLDDRPVRSCLVYACQADGHSVTTIEGIAADDGSLHPLQEALSRHHGLQCGFCTPGMVMTALDLYTTDGSMTRDEIRAAISGNLCRCTGYLGIVDAIEACLSASPRP